MQCLTLLTSKTTNGILSAAPQEQYVVTAQQHFEERGFRFKDCPNASVRQPFHLNIKMKQNARGIKLNARGKLC